MLPPERIAQRPIEPRDASRLMLLSRASGERKHTHFRDLPDLLTPNDTLVLNRSRVIPARLAARKVPGGGKAEILLIERISADTWKAMVGGKGLGVGKRLELGNGVRAEIIEQLQGPQRIVRFDQALDAKLEALGEMPLPPYIHERLEDPERYQTVFASQAGSAAAPTAGLHFTPELLAKLKASGINIVEITLHIGLDTFAPVAEEQPTQHAIHSEWCQLSPAAAESLNQAKVAGGRITAVGTTAVRVLESAAQNSAPGAVVAPFEGRTDLFILPGYAFKAVDAMLTNFHLPRSTLIMLVSAFAGRELILESYQEAIAQEYRFYSFGDAMFIY